MTKVSMVVPVYNAEEYLGQCVESILGQTLKDIEVICVNDGSTDRSLDILKKYAAQDERLVIIDKPNSGYGASMNQGLDAAKGEYFGIVDSDDYIRPTMLEDLYRLAKSNDLDFVRGSYDKFSVEDGEEVHTTWPSMGDRYKNTIFCPREADPFYMSAVVIPTGIYKVEFMRENEIRFNETPGAAFQDHGVWFQTHILADRALFVDESYYCYRWDNAGSSIHNPKAAAIMGHEYDLIQGFVERHEADLGTIVNDFYWKARWANTVLAGSRVLDENFGPASIQSVIDTFLVARADGELSTALFSEKQIKDLNSMLDDPEAYCRKLVIQEARKEYKQYIKTQRGGKQLNPIQKYNWFAERYGRSFAKSLAMDKFKRKVDGSEKSKDVSIQTLTSLTKKNQTALTKQIRTLSAQVRNLEKKNEMLFWWMMHQQGESLSDTQMRVYASMPPAEGDLRQRQVDYANLLADFKRVMVANDLEFWPMGGSMIGMIRHKGFVPWDDDIDISMYSDDRERLFEAIQADDVLQIEEVYWIGGTDALRCPRISYIDPMRGEGLVDIFFWERCNADHAADSRVWNIRNRYHQKLYSELQAAKKTLHKPSRQGEGVHDAHDKAIIEEIFDRNRKECLDEIGQGGTSIFGSIEMWFAAGKWKAVYTYDDMYPMRAAEFEGEQYLIPSRSELMLNMQYGDWMGLPAKVSPNHGG